MKIPIIILWMATILAIVFFDLTQRYTIVASTSEFPVGYKLDKLTGKVWCLRGYRGQTLVPVIKDQKKK